MGDKNKNSWKEQSSLIIYLCIEIISKVGAALSTLLIYVIFVANFLGFLIIYLSILSGFNLVYNNILQGIITYAKISEFFKIIAVKCINFVRYCFAVIKQELYIKSMFHITYMI